MLMGHRWALMLAMLASGLSLAGPVSAAVHHLEISQTQIVLDGVPRMAMTINGTLPAPTLYFDEGEDLEIHVTNHLPEISSVHWHGLIVPYTQDGAPQFSYDGIAPGETFVYRFGVQQAGTYWYHSHSNMQEQRGMYGAIVIRPKVPDPFEYDREQVLVLSDWHNTHPHRILTNLKREPDYYNFHQPTLTNRRQPGPGQTQADLRRERAEWGRMRMLPSDIADVSGYDFLINGMTPAQNWVLPFTDGERLRLRLVNASAMSIVDVYIPGLKMRVVQADGNNIEPVVVDELRMAVGETYDVIVEPDAERAYTLMIEPMARTGYGRITLSPSPDMSAEVPARRPRPELTLADMPASHAGHAMQHMSGHEQHAGHAHQLQTLTPGTGNTPATHQLQTLMPGTGSTPATHQLQTLTPGTGSTPATHQLQTLTPGTVAAMLSTRRAVACYRWLTTAVDSCPIPTSRLSTPCSRCARQTAN